MSEVQTSLGKLIEIDNPLRDAVHIAVAPVVADVRLKPGDHIGFVKPGDASLVGRATKPVGIVDPFLSANVRKGDRFWMYLYPNTITSLKHVWTHPAFPEAPAAMPSDKAASEAWLRAFVAGADCPGYETVIAAAVDGGDASWDSDYLHFNDRDAHGKIPPEFWDHVEVVTGQKITKRATYFSCSC